MLLIYFVIYFMLLVYFELGLKFHRLRPNIYAGHCCYLVLKLMNFWWRWPMQVAHLGENYSEWTHKPLTGAPMYFESSWLEMLTKNPWCSSALPSPL